MKGLKHGIDGRYFVAVEHNCVVLEPRFAMGLKYPTSLASVRPRNPFKTLCHHHDIVTNLALDHPQFNEAPDSGSVAREVIYGLYNISGSLLKIRKSFGGYISVWQNGLNEIPERAIAKEEIPFFYRGLDT